MEDWEIELRQKLEDELPEGMYNLRVIYSGKAGYIEHEIAFRRVLRDQLAKMTKNDGKH